MTARNVSELQAAHLSEGKYFMSNHLKKLELNNASDKGLSPLLTTVPVYPQGEGGGYSKAIPFVFLDVKY